MSQICWGADHHGTAMKETFFQRNSAGIRARRRDGSRGPNRQKATHQGRLTSNEDVSLHGLRFIGSSMAVSTGRVQGPLYLCTLDQLATIVWESRSFVAIN
jgi:hypothetical protein